MYAPEVLVLIAIIIIAAIFLLKPSDGNKLDLNKDGKIDEKDLTEAKKNLKKAASDINKIKDQIK